MRGAVALAAVMVMVMAAGCHDSVSFSFSDQGMVCLSPPTAQPTVGQPATTPATFAAGQPVAVSVIMPICLSSSCSKDASATCRVTMLDATTLQVKSQGGFRLESGGACTTDCGLLVAHCQTAPLAPGRYQFRHRNDTVTLEVPSTVSSPCAGIGPF